MLPYGDDDRGCWWSAAGGWCHDRPEPTYCSITIHYRIRLVQGTLTIEATDPYTDETDDVVEKAAIVSRGEGTYGWWSPVSRRFQIAVDERRIGPAPGLSDQARAALFLTRLQMPESNLGDSVREALERGEWTYDEYRPAGYLHNAAAAAVGLLGLCSLALSPLWIKIRASRFRGRTRPGHCPSCGYDRAGLMPLQTCPECGTTPVWSSRDPKPPPPTPAPPSKPPKPLPAPSPPAHSASPPKPPTSMP